MNDSSAIVVLTNPAPHHDYLVELGGATADGAALRIRYVPDRVVMDAAAAAPWLAGFAGGLEAVALRVLDDLNNELVPRWVEVTAERDTPVHHRVVAEDRQPGWDNPHLLARMERI